MDRSATDLLITDVSFHRYLNKLSLWLEIADDLFALVKEPLVPLHEYSFRVVNSARGLGSVEYSGEQGLSGPLKPQYRLDLAALNIGQLLLLQPLMKF